MAAVVLNDNETLLEAVPATPAVSRAVTIADDGTAVTDHALLVDAPCRGEPGGSRLGVRAATALTPRLHCRTGPGCRSSWNSGSPPVTWWPRRIFCSPGPGPRVRARLPGVAVAEVAAGHDLMLTRPDETATALERVVL